MPPQGAGRGRGALTKRCFGCCGVLDEFRVLFAQKHARDRREFDERGTRAYYTLKNLYSAYFLSLMRSYLILSSILHGCSLVRWCVLRRQMNVGEHVLFLRRVKRGTAAAAVFSTPLPSALTRCRSAHTVVYNIPPLCRHYLRRIIRGDNE